MSLRKGIALFLGITLFSVGLVLFFTVDKETLRFLFSANKAVLLQALGLVILSWFFDALRFMSFAKAAGERVGFRLSICLSWLNYFGSAITPMQGGGGPFQVYVLYRNGIAVGKGIAITLTRTLITLFIVGCVVAMTLIFAPDILSGSTFVTGIFYYVAAFVLLTWIVVAFSLVCPKAVKKLGKIATLLLKRIGIVKPMMVLRVVRRLNREIDNYTENFRLFFTSGFSFFVTGIVLSFGQLLCLWSVLPTLVKAIGIPIHYGQAILIQALFNFVMYFVPTPGASGFAEAGGATIFRYLIPWNLAGVMAIGWRFFTEYLAIGLGAIVALRFLGWGMAEKILDEAKREENEP
ncbi:MAG: YbhN family protein [Synergistales bacterium]